MNQMEITSVAIDSLNASSCDESTRELAHRKDSDDEALEEDDYAPFSFETLLTSIEKKLPVQPKRIKVSSSKILTSIHKVPPILFQQDKKAYIPHVVSIGPFHYQKRKKKLQAVEEHKWRYLNEIIKRKGKAWFGNCIVAVKKKEGLARECYSQVIKLNSNSFVEMMLLDGFFIIELFRKNWCQEFEEDPLFKLEWLNCVLTIDLVMLENQIPFFILQKLFRLLDISSFSLEAAALKFFRTWCTHRGIRMPESKRICCSNLHFHHLLHLLHENMVLSTEKEYQPGVHNSESIPCASRLRESGIKFKKRDLNNDVGNLLDIKFDKEKGIIEIPLSYLGDGTNPILRNLIAFEQCYLHCKKYITAYTYFMDCLINSSKDVEILVQKGIIKNRLGSDEDVALFFNKIHKGVLIHYHKSFYLMGICEEINHYCGTTWPKLRATLMHDYFKSPWAIISFIAAVSFLLLAVMQAFFSAFPKFAIGK